MAARHRHRLNDPDLRDRLYDVLEHDHLAGTIGWRVIRLIILVIILDVTATVLASVPAYDARFGSVFTAIKIGAIIVFALEYGARLWSAAGHSPKQLSPFRARIEFIFSGLGVIDLMAFLPATIALIMGARSTLMMLAVLPFFKLVRYSPAMRCSRPFMPSGTR